ncbi:MAG: hypothetical protein WC304_03235, partial [Candidatus Gracilibacteria bacterium]
NNKDYISQVRGSEAQITQVALPKTKVFAKVSQLQISSGCGEVSSFAKATEDKGLEIREIQKQK